MVEQVATPWERAIILVDMNAFFASIEQLDQPEWRGRPVAVTNGLQGSCIITCSYEARAYGIKTGMRLWQARELCPELIQCPGRPQRYAQVSRRIMAALEAITPDIEVFSVDEAFLDVTHCQGLHGDPATIGRMTQRLVFETANLLCSVGVSGDKTTAKYAAKLQKPNGFTVIPPWEAKERLRWVKVTELCGIAEGIGRFLARHGVYYCGDMEKLPISVLARRFGNVGRRIWFMCQGADPDPVHTRVAAPKSVGHGKVMPPGTWDRQVILTYLLHMSEKVGARLRRYGLAAEQFFIGLRTDEFGWIAEKARLPRASNDGGQIYALCQQLLQTHWQGQPVSQVQITALSPRPALQQGDLFLADDTERRRVNAAQDAINARFGEFVIAPARLLNRSSMPNVIAPAWKPDGHRQTIPE
jgi:DNA polymerase-4